MADANFSERVGRLWSEGEELSSGGDHAGALLQFQRAKALLLHESKSMVGNQSVGTSSNASKVLGQIMQKLSTSIDRDVATLSKNPVHALGLNRGFNKTDVKKAYRKSALKYHPDKNTDCDTSCIFAAIQSSYEKLNAAIDDSSSFSASHNSGPTSTGATPRTSSMSTNGGTTFTHVPGSKNPQGSNNARPSPYEFKSFQEREYARQQTKASQQKKQEYREKELRERERAKAAEQGDEPEPIFHPSFNQRNEKRSFRQEASYLSEMPTAGLRKMLRQFGFGELVESMTREELIKKYLAVSSHLEAKRGGGGAGAAKPSAARGRRPSEFRTDSADEAEDPGLFEDLLQAEAAAFNDCRRKSGGGSGGGGNGSGLEHDYEEMAQRWATEWATEMRAELDREQNRHRVQTKQKEQLQRQQQPHFQQRHQPAPKPTASVQPAAGPSPILPGSARSNEDKAETRRHKTADALRQERSNWLAGQLPLMSLSELRRLMLSAGVAGVEPNGGEGREELSDRLCLHFGIRKEEVLAASERQGAAAGGAGAPRPRPERGGASFTPAEAAMNAKILVDGKMDIESIKKVVSSIGQRVAPSTNSQPLPPLPTKANPVNPASIVTKERLQEIERKLMGDYRRPARNAQPAAATRDRPDAEVSSSPDRNPPPPLRPLAASAASNRFPTNQEHPVPDPDNDDDDSIDPDDDLDFMEQIRMNRWKISELYIPEPELELGEGQPARGGQTGVGAAGADVAGEVGVVGGIRIAQSMLESDDSDADDDDEDEDEDDEEDESKAEGRTERSAEGITGAPGAASEDKQASPLGNRAWSSDGGRGEEMSTRSNNPADGHPEVGAAKPAAPPAVPRLPDFESLQSLDLDSSGLAEGQTRMVGRLRASRSGAGAGGGEGGGGGDAGAGASSAALSVKGTQRSPEQAAELQEEVEFWVHSPRGISYQDMQMNTRNRDQPVLAAGPPVATVGDGFIFFG